MAWIPMPEEEGAQGALADLYAQGRDPRTGAVDHILRIHGLHPAGLAAHLQIYTTVMRGTATFPKVERELVALVVSQENSCHY